jgi:hypothetical protein
MAGDHEQHRDDHDSADDALDPGEPETPMWLPLLGIGLLLLSILVFVATRPADDDTAELDNTAEPAPAQERAAEAAEAPSRPGNPVVRQPVVRQPVVRQKVVPSH